MKRDQNDKIKWKTIFQFLFVKTWIYIYLIFYLFCEVKSYLLDFSNENLQSLALINFGQQQNFSKLTIFIETFEQIIIDVCKIALCLI